MEKVVHVFKSIREAEEFDRDYYQSLTPKQRVDILLELVRDVAKLQDDLREFVELLAANRTFNE